jgi:uncharacterized protein (DUF1778 family)
MAKIATVRMDDKAYQLIRKAAEGERRSISNFLEYAALRYLTDDLSVSNREMEEIMSDPDLVSSLKQGLADVEAGRFSVVE